MVKNNIKYIDFVLKCVYIKTRNKAKNSSKKAKSILKFNQNTHHKNTMPHFIFLNFKLLLRISVKDEHVYTI